jgi:hypothetical protein
MALIYPINRTDYLGQIHFSSLEETTTGGEATAAAKSSDATKKSKSSGFSPSDMLAFMGASSEFSSILGGSGPVPSGEKCILHLPQGITIADKADYGTANLGMIGGAVEAGAIAAQEGSMPSITSFLDSLKGGAGKDLGKLAVAKTVGAFSEEAGNAIKAQAKVTSNPNSRALFNSVPLRSFTFSFKMIPHSQEEARNIKEIITFFRKELYPEEIPANLGEIQFSVGYKFPNRFGIKMYYGSGNNIKEVGTRIQPAYLTDMQTVYNSSTMGMHYDGNFSEVDLTLSFLESKALSRKDVIDEGFAEGILDEEGNML